MGSGVKGGIKSGGTAGETAEVEGQRCGAAEGRDSVGWRAAVQSDAMGGRAADDECV